MATTQIAQPNGVTNKTTLDLDEKLVSNTALTKADVIRLLETNWPDYLKTYGQSKIRDIQVKNVGKGNGYMSDVLRVCIKFEGHPDFRFVLKIPLPTAISSMIDNEKKPDSKQAEAQKGEVVDDENVRTIIYGHNLECEFYDRFQNKLGDYPIPRVYYTKKIESNETASSSLILMEDLSLNGGTVLGLCNPVSADQVYAVSRAIATFQFYAERQEEQRDWWMSLEKNLHLDTFYSSWLPVGMEAAHEMREFAELLPLVSTICTREFGHYAIRQRAQEYNAITICQGDVQPFNVFFKTASGGQLTANLKAIIDYQLLLYGNPCFDLARFVVCAVNPSVRQESDERAYQIYYNELKRLKEENGQKVKFSYEQGQELFHLALCQQATFLTAFLFFLHAMSKQSKEVEDALPTMIDRAKYSLTCAVGYIQKYNLNRTF